MNAVSAEPLQLPQEKCLCPCWLPLVRPVIWFSVGDKLVGVLQSHQRFFPLGLNSESSLSYSKFEGLVLTT